MKKEKLLIVIPTLGFGGAERTALYIAEELSKNNREVEFCLFQDHIQYDNHFKVSFLDQSGRKKGLFRYIHRLWHLKKIVKEGAFNHIISFNESANIICVLLKFFYPQKRIILSVRTHLSAWQKFNGFNFRHKILRLFIQIFYRIADCVIVNSKESALSLVNDYKLPKKNVLTIYNPINLNRINQLSAQNSTQYIDKPYLVTHGRLVPEKGHLELLQVFKLISDKISDNLLIIGDGPLKNKILDKARELNINERVILIGEVANPFAFLKNAEIFLLTSHFEGFPNSLIEAMACGIPCIAFDCPSGPAEIINNEQSGLLITQGDVRKMAEAILTLKRNQNKREMIIQNGKSQVKMFDAPIIASEFERIIFNMDKQDD